jgi:GntR family transcriptional regulator
MRYLDLADLLRNRIASGRIGQAGGALPSEAEFVDEFSTSRVTVRRALELLRGEGLVMSRRGAGWFIAPGTVRQSLGRVTTVEAALEASGATPQRRVFDFGFEPASGPVAKLLQTHGEVLRVGRVNLADGHPFAVVMVWVPSDIGRDLSRADVETATFYDLLPFSGVRFGRVHQRIGADLATAHDAKRLGIAKGTAVVTCRRLTFDVADRPVLLADHRYPADRTSFEIELSSVAFASPPINGVLHG